MPKRSKTGKGPAQIDWVEAATGDRRGRQRAEQTQVFRCTGCGRPLKGAESLSMGLGPVCRGDRHSNGARRTQDVDTLDWVSPARNPSITTEPVSLEAGGPVLLDLAA